MPKVRVVKYGDGLAIRIPKAAAKRARVREGDSLFVEASKGRITLFAERMLTLDELISRITPKNLHGETHWGPDVGNEIVDW